MARPKVLPELAKVLLKGVDVDSQKHQSNPQSRRDELTCTYDGHCCLWCQGQDLQVMLGSSILHLHPLPLS